MKEKYDPAKKVGKTANLIIFIGILYSSLSILGITVCSFFVDRGFGWKSLPIGLSIVGLGYGIRYGKKPCLYITTGIFSVVFAYFLYRLLNESQYMLIPRVGLCLWAIISLTTAIPAMLTLEESGGLPDRNSKYKDFFLRRKQKT